MYLTKNNLGTGQDWAGLLASVPPITFPNTGEAPSCSPLAQPGGIHLAPTMTVVSSEALAMTLSLCGHQSISSTGPVCPVTSG